MNWSRPRLEGLEDRLAPAIYNVSDTTTLLAALKAATAFTNEDFNNTILVAPGHYPVVDLQIFPHGRTLTIKGTGPDPAAVVVDGQQKGRVMTVAGDLIPTTGTGALTIENLTVTGGQVKGKFPTTNPDEVAEGGGIDIATGNITLKDIVVTGNTVIGTVDDPNRQIAVSGVAQGGGIFVPYSDKVNVTIIDSVISNNKVIGGKGAHDFGGWTGMGGGLFVAGGNVSLFGCMIQNNQAVGGDAIASYPEDFNLHGRGEGYVGGSGAGGGIAQAGGRVTVYEGAISNNGATGGQGANGADANPLLDGDFGGEGGKGGGGKGGGVYVEGGVLTVIDAFIDHNAARGGRGGDGGAAGNGKKGSVGDDGHTGGFTDTTTSGRNYTRGVGHVSGFHGHHGGGGGSTSGGAGGDGSGGGCFVTGSGSLSLVRATVYADTAQGGDGVTPPRAGNAADGGAGGNAILAEGFEFSHQLGGPGGDGGQGGHGGNVKGGAGGNAFGGAIFIDATAFIYAGSLAGNAIGGNGAKGGQGGAGAGGGAGGIGIGGYVVYANDGTQIHLAFTDGNPGKGGDGGISAGGDGGDATGGSAYIDADATAATIEITPTGSAKGGAGGQPGNGGPAGGSGGHDGPAFPGDAGNDGVDGLKNDSSISVATKGPDAIKFLFSPIPTIAGGRPFTLYAIATDDAGHVAGNFKGKATLALAKGSTGSKLAGDVTVDVVNGVAIFSNIEVDDGSGPSFALNAVATDTNTNTNITGTTNDFEVDGPITVNSLGDEPAASPSSGKPFTSAGTITLRSAIQTANAVYATTGIPTLIRFAIPNGPGVIKPKSPFDPLKTPMVIDASSQPGIHVSGNLLQRGTNTDGLNLQASGITIRGLVIENFPHNGITILDPGGDTITGNQILSNAGGGVSIFNASNNIIGGTSLGAGNVISGNVGNGLVISGGHASLNVVQGNYIGSKIGTSSVGNTGNGIYIDGGTHNTIGGTTNNPGLGAGNVIADNAMDGVLLSGAASDNQLQGNLIGPNKNGIEIDGANNNTIGGLGNGAANVISANKLDGVLIDGKATGNLLRGNLIGTDKTGTAKLGNLFYGVDIFGGSKNTIGGVLGLNGAGNIVSGNKHDGVVIRGNSATGNVVQANFIGTAKDGTTPLGNGGNGVMVTDSASGNLIGGDTELEGNTVADNAGVGVLVGTDPANGFTTPGGAGNAIMSNMIFANGLLGIALGPASNSTLPNTPGGPHQGPNNLQNYPQVSPPFANEQGETLVEVTLNSTPGKVFTLQFFANTVPDSAGLGGSSRLLLTVKSVYTNVFGNAIDHDGNSKVTVNLGLNARHANEFITATATDDANNTSEFSIPRNPVLVVPGIGGSMAIGANYKTWLQERGLPPSALAIDPLAHAYDDLIQTLENVGYEKGQDLFAATYDWRIAPGPTEGTANGVVSGVTPDTISADLQSAKYKVGVDYLAYWLNEAVQAWKINYPGLAMPGVDIIAHSTGGLVTRAYIQSPAYRKTVTGPDGAFELPKINNFIMIGVPNQGAPAPFLALNDDWGFDPTYHYILSYLFSQPYNKLVSKKVESIPGPDRTITLNSIETKPGDESTVSPQLFIQQYCPTIQALVATYPFVIDLTGKLSNPGTNAFLTGLNGGPKNAFANPSLVKQVVDIYGTTENQPLSVITNLGTGGDVVSITGVHPTLIRQIWYTLKKLSTGGDGTVPVISTAGMFVDDPNIKLRPFPGVSHLGELHDRDVETQVLTSLNEPASPDLISTASGTNYSLDNIWTVTSDPVDAVLVDANGSQLGYVTGSGAVTQIPNSIYLGDENGIGFIFGPVAMPVHLELTGLGSDYLAQVAGRQGNFIASLEAEGTLDHGQQNTAAVPVQALPAPVVTSVKAVGITAAGATSVLITGSNLGNVASVLFGSMAATEFTIDSDTQITAVAPAHAPGTVDVSVVDPAAGTSATSSSDQFTYLAPLTLGPAALSASKAASTFNAPLNATGGSGHYNFAVAAGSALPPGMTLSAGGILGGTPTTAGAFSFTIVAADSATVGRAGTKQYSLTINAAAKLSLNPATLASGAVGSSFGPVTFKVLGGYGAYTLALAKGSVLPPGLTLRNGVLSGTPTTAGTIAFTITATDNSRHSLTGSLRYVLAVNSAVVLNPVSATATVGNKFSRQLAAKGGSGKGYTFTATGLPVWLTLSSAGLLGGTPTSAVGSPLKFQVTITDSNGASRTYGYSLIIDPALVISPATLLAATVGKKFSTQLSAKGGSGKGFIFKATGRPAWLTLSSTGLLSGTPPAGTSGLVNFTVSVTDSLGATVSASYSLTIGGA